MDSYLLNIDRDFLWFFIMRSFGDEFRTIFGDILSYLSSNIGNEGKTFNSSCNTARRPSNFDSDICKRLCYFKASAYSNHLYSCLPAMLFINYKLFLVVRKSRRNKRISPDMKNTFSLKNISSCLLAVACVVVLSIPVGVYVGLTINSKKTFYTLDANLARMSSTTIASMNCTFNCLIFYWKNKVLRTEGLKVLKSLQICRRTGS